MGKGGGIRKIKKRLEIVAFRRGALSQFKAGLTRKNAT